MLFRKKERNIGPHVIEPTAEKKRVHYNSRDLGSHTVWRCKYCEWSGAHPSVTPVNINIKEDCNDVEWLPSEVEEFEREYCR